MRYLFTTIPGFGHFYPIVPLAHALIAAGHDVAIATAAAFCPAVEAAGLTAIPAGLDWDESHLMATVPELGDIAQERQGDWIMQKLFLDRSPRQMICSLRKIVPTWQPDVILSGTYEFGGALAAELLELPYASCSISFRWTRWLLKLSIGQAMTRIRREIGLPRDPDFRAFGRYLDLCFVPPSWTLSEALMRPGLSRIVRSLVINSNLSLNQRLAGIRALVLRHFLKADQGRDMGGASIGNTSFIGRSFSRETTAALPDWLADLPRQPTIYMTLGTVFGTQYAQLFDAVLAGLSKEPVNLVLTVGEELEPARFGAQPANVRIVQFIPESQVNALLSIIDLCICHSGYGTVMSALAHGIPLVLLPLAADQPVIAQTCLLDGVAPELPVAVWRLNAKGLPIVRPDRVTPSLVRDVALAAMHDPRYRSAAQAMQAQLESLPDVTHAVTLLEGIARS